jgi:hypothetical protein
VVLSGAQRAGVAAAESAAAYRKYVTQPTVVLSGAQRAGVAAAESAAAYRKYVTRPTAAAHSGAQYFPRGGHAPPVVSEVRPWSPAVVTKPRVAPVTKSPAKPAVALADPTYGPSDPQYGAAVSGATVAHESGARHARRSRATGTGLRAFFNRLLGGN